MAAEHESSEDTYQFFSLRPKGGEPRLVEFNPANMIVSRPQQRQGKQFVMEIKYRLDGVFVPLCLQFPRMFSPFPLGKPYDDSSRNRHLTLGFHGEEDRPELVAFRGLLDSINRALIETLVENKEDWFLSGRSSRKRHMTADTIRAGYHEFVKDGYSEKSSRNYPDNITLKIQVRKDMMEATFFDENNCYIESTDTLEVTQSDIIAVATLSEMWFINEQFYPKFKLRQAKVFQNQVIDRTFGIVNSEPASTSTFDDAGDKLETSSWTGDHEHDAQPTAMDTETTPDGEWDPYEEQPRTTQASDPGPPLKRHRSGMDAPPPL